MAAVLNFLATVHRDVGNYDQAQSLYEEAASINAAALGTRHDIYAISLNNLANLYVKMGDYEMTWEYTLQAIEATSGHRLSKTITQSWADTLLQTSFPSNRHLGRAIRSIRMVYKLLRVDSTVQDALAAKIIITDLAAALLAKFRNNTSNDQDKLRTLAQSNEWLQRSLQTLHGLGQEAKAFDLVDQNKSVLLLQASQSEQAYRLGNLPDSLIALDKALNKEKSQLQAQLLEQRTFAEKDSLRAALTRINRDQDALASRIQTEYPKYYRLKYQSPKVEASEIQALLDPQTALLEYAISDSVLHIFYIDQAAVVWKKMPVTRKTLARRIEKLHQALSNPTLLQENPERSYQDYTDQAHWFYQQLIAPILPPSTAIQNLVIVTDGALGHLPFETFLVEPAAQRQTSYQNLHYLVQDFTISYNYSAVLWKEHLEAPQPVNNGQLFGLAANYDLVLDSSLTAVRSSIDQKTRATLSALPGARREVEVLKDLYQGFFAFDSLASERIVKANAGDFAVLHFATHGLLNEQRPMLSSLALSEDNAPTESNFWQAHEISKLELKANLVVLSACETGYGKFEQGNGIASLARAFMYAGAPSLVVSLWQVNDYATAQIMQHFYANIAEGMRVDGALRQAKLQYLQGAAGDAAHPMFWSAFVHIGKAEPVTLKRKGLGWWPWVLGAVVILGVIGIGMIRRREVA